MLVKLVALLNKKRTHYINRIKLRKGKSLYLLFAKQIDKRKDGMQVYKYKSHIYFIQNYKLQTYIKTTSKSLNYTKIWI